MKDYKILCFDIDGVLTNETEGHDYENRTPFVPNVELIKRAYKQRSRFKIMIFTSRYEIDYDVTVSWLTKHEIMFDEIIFGKPTYDLFLDDKNADREWMELTIDEDGEI